MERFTTAIYPNRVADKQALEDILNISEEGNDFQNFFLTNGDLFAIGYTRVVYGDHGPYLEFDKRHIQCPLRSKYGNNIDFDNLPENPRFYYYWLYPESSPDVKVYLQLKPVTDLPNAPRRLDGKKSSFNRTEGYADYRRGFYYVDPYSLYLKRLIK